MLSRSKAPKHSKFAITVKFFSCLTRASTLIAAKTLLTQVLVQNFPFLFMFIIPWPLAITKLVLFYLYMIECYLHMTHHCLAFRPVPFITGCLWKLELSAYPPIVNLKLMMANHAWVVCAADLEYLVSELQSIFSIYIQ